MALFLGGISLGTYPAIQINDAQLLFIVNDFVPANGTH